MYYTKILAEFLGTYIMCLIFILYLNYSKNYDFLELITVLFFSIFIPTVIFYNYSYDFNPALTLMFYFNGNRSNTELISYISSQLLAAWAAYSTFNLIKFEK